MTDDPWKNAELTTEEMIKAMKEALQIKQTPDPPFTPFVHVGLHLFERIAKLDGTYSPELMERARQKADADGWVDYPLDQLHRQAGSQICPRQ